MNQQMPLERQIAGWMVEEAAGVPDGLLDQILSNTKRSRPAPRWWALLRESPMRSARVPVAVGLANRGLVFAGLLGLLLVALVAAVVAASLLFNLLNPAAEDWPGFRGDADRNGLALQGPAGGPVLAWQFQASGGVLEVAIVGDRAYFASDDGHLYAVSRNAGVRQWSIEAGAGPLTGPYAADGRLYVSDSAGSIRAFGQVDGAAIWTASRRYETPSRMLSIDGTLYFGTADGLVVALDGATGAERWRMQPTGAIHVDAPAFAGGLLYVGTDGAGFVAIDPATQRVVWSGDTANEDTGTAALADGIAYIGASAEAVTGPLRAFDARSGRLLWTSSDDLLVAPAVAGGIGYSSTIRGLVTAFDTATGAVRWHLQLRGEVRGPVVAGAVVYLFAGLEHRLYAVDAASGDLLWTFDFGDTGNCCIAVARGAVFVGLQNGSVEAIVGDGRPVAAVPFPTLPGASPTPTVPATPGPTLGPLTPTWTSDLRGLGFAPICQIAVDPAGRIWAPEAETDRIAIFDATGRLIEEWGGRGSGPGQFDFTRGNGDGYGTLAFEPDGSYFILDVGNRRVQAFDGNRQFLREWGTFGTGPAQYSDPVGIAVAADGTLWVLDDVRRVAEHYDRSGTVLGSFDPFSNTATFKGANGLAIGPNGHLYVAQAEPNQVAEFAEDGTFIRTYGATSFPNEQPTQLAVDVAGRVFVTQGPGRGDLPGVTVFAADGSLLGGFGPTGAGDGQLSFPAGIATDGHGSMYVLDSDPDSARLFKVPLAPPFAS